MTLLTSSIAQAGSYQKTYGVIVDPILDSYGIPHSYSGPNLESSANLSNADLRYAFYVETSTGSPCYYPNTMLSSGFDPVAQGWRLAPYCDFTPDASCDLADINQMFHAGKLVTGVTTSGSTDRLDLVDNDTLDASDITEWLAPAATTNGHGSPCRRGDTELDRDVDITDFNLLASDFSPGGYATSAIPEPSTVAILLLGLGCVMFLCCSRSWR